MVAVVTGAGSGIGRSVCRLFTEQGAKIVAIDCDQNALLSLSSEIENASQNYHHFVCDVGDPNPASEIVAKIEKIWGRVDILITSAVHSVGKTVLETEISEWREVFRVNVEGTFIWTQAVLPLMIRRKAGVFVLIASQLAIRGGRANAAYVASKGAVISLTRSLALDYAPDGIRANVLIPGAIQTPRLKRAFDRHPDPSIAELRSLERHPLGRFGDPQDVARTALFLASKEAAFITGAEIPVDGGYLIH
jgi:NAD(P)-dependent dehydrogenase (short-subunit alcohol dehydrogenase family)